MEKFVKAVLFLLLAVALYGAADDSFDDFSAEQNVHLLPLGMAQAKVSTIQLPYFPEAELASNGLQMHQVMTSRIQRANVLEYYLSLRNLVYQLAGRVAALAQHSGRIYDTTTSYYCHPASEYYIFALRRILI